MSPAPPEELVTGLNPCGRAVLTLLWYAEGPPSAERVREALEVRRALRLLHPTHKVIPLSRHRPCGFFRR